MTVLGIDGCRRGWAAVELGSEGAQWLPWTADVADLLRRDADAVAIDAPIGLPDRGRRSCDVAARRMLGRRGASVFAAPVRAVLDCSTYADARAVLAGLGGPSMSAQAFGIVRAVQQVDAAMSPADEDRVIEAHPEVAFAVMSGEVLPSKQSGAGVAGRIALLESHLDVDVRALLTDLPPRFRLDDAIDSLACAWVARCWVAGTAVVLGDGARDARGLQMRIVTGSPPGDVVTIAPPS